MLAGIVYFVDLPASATVTVTFVASVFLSLLPHAASPVATAASATTAMPARRIRRDPMEVLSRRVGVATPYSGGEARVIPLGSEPSLPLTGERSIVRALASAVAPRLSVGILGPGCRRSAKSADEGRQGLALRRVP